MQDLEEREEREESAPRRPPQKKWNRGRILTILLLILAILLTTTLISNRDRLTLDHLRRAIHYRGLGTSIAEEFRFANLPSNTFALAHEGIAVASGGGLRVYDRAGTLVYTEIFEMTTPIIETAGEFILAFDLDGTSIQTGTRREGLIHLTADGRLIDASVNENGWIVASIERVGTVGLAYVYDPSGTPVLRVSSTGHLIRAGLAANNRSLVLLTMTPTGGRALWYTVGVGGDPQHEFIHEDEIFFDFWFTSPGGSIGLISNNMVLFLTEDGQVQSEYHFPDRYLRAYDISGGNVALYLSASLTGSAGELIILEPGGREQRIEISRNLFDISLNGRYLATLCHDELTVYRGTAQYARWRETEGMHQVLMRADGTVLRLSPHRARLLVP